jgi:hypothetical protein
MRLKLLKDMQPGLYKNNTFWMKRMKTYWHYHDPVLLMYEEKIMNTDKRKVAPLMARLTRDVRKFAAKIVQFRDMIATFEQSMMATTHAMNDLIASPEGSTFAAVSFVSLVLFFFLRVQHSRVGVRNNER